MIVEGHSEQLLPMQLPWAFRSDKFAPANRDSNTFDDTEHSIFKIMPTASQ